MKNFFVVMLILGAAVALATATQRDARAETDIYPCNICTVFGAPTLTRFKPDNCGEHWRQKVNGTRYYVSVVCQRQASGAWLVYVWACPICKAGSENEYG